MNITQTVGHFHWTNDEDMRIIEKLYIFQDRRYLCVAMDNYKSEYDFEAVNNFCEFKNIIDVQISSSIMLINYN